MSFEPTTNIFMLIDSELMRMAVRQTLQAAPRCVLVGEAADTDSLLDHFGDGHVDVLIVKRTAVRGSLPEWVRLVKSQSALKVLLLLNSPNEFFECASSGVDGFMLTDSAAYLFPVAIRVLHEGGCWIAPMIARHLLGDVRREAPAVVHNSPPQPGEDLLTTKEREVMRHLNEGLTNAQIAARLNLSVETIRVHVRNILRKLGVRDRTEAVNKTSGQFMRR